MERGPSRRWRNGEGRREKRGIEIRERDSERVGLQAGRVVGPGLVRRGLQRQTWAVHGSKNRFRTRIQARRLAWPRRLRVHHLRVQVPRRGRCRCRQVRPGRPRRRRACLSRRTLHRV